MPMFDAKFYQTVLPASLQQSCSTQPEHVPVVELHLPDGTTLDLACIEALTETWLAVEYFRNPTQDNVTETAFLPYSLVQWITVSMHPQHMRHIGFDMARSATASILTPAANSPLTATTASPADPVEAQIPDAHSAQ